MVKKCFKCLKVKDLNDFYRHPQMSDGHLGKCKECAKVDSRGNYKQEIVAKKAYEKKRTQDPHRKAKKLEYQRTRRKNRPERNKAYMAVSRAVKNGKLVKMSCRDCGDKKVEAHHSDYSKPLDVAWLCFACHRREHGQIV